MSHHEKPAEHPNAKLMRDMTAAFVSSDMDAMASFLTDDVEWHEIGRDDPIVGRDALAARWAGMAGAGGTFTTEAHDLIANDDHGVALIWNGVLSPLPRITEDRR